MAFTETAVKELDMSCVAYCNFTEVFLNHVASDRVKFPYYTSTDEKLVAFSEYDEQEEMTNLLMSGIAV